MDEFVIKSVAGEDILQYYKLASRAYHTYRKDFGSEEHIAQMMAKEERNRLKKVR